MSKYQSKLSRREALTRMTVMAAALPMVGCVYIDTESTVAELPWPDAEPIATAVGYGSDPNLIAPLPSPWPRILSAEDMDVLAALSEAFCSGATDAGVPDVLNEWLSAPYPNQHRDRVLVAPGIRWLGQSFVSLAAGERRNFLARLEDNSVSAVDEHVPAFIRRARQLVAGAFFSSPAGISELGYVGNRPIAGDYPGASIAAEKHLGALLLELGLEP
ncbi:MAG: hypothetical protein ACI9ON_003961 [Limisphaerales bacterium]|jgi:hypothetical protein